MYIDSVLSEKSLLHEGQAYTTYRAYPANKTTTSHGGELTALTGELPHQRRASSLKRYSGAAAPTEHFKCRPALRWKCADSVYRAQALL